MPKPVTIFVMAILVCMIYVTFLLCCLARFAANNQPFLGWVSAPNCCVKSIVEHRNISRFFAIICAFCVLATPAQAQLNPQTKLSLEASQKAVSGDYRGAIAIYNQLIRMDAKDARYYIDRGLMYRQIKNIPKSMADGAMVLEIANYKLSKRSEGKRAAKSYWQRGQGYRLLEKYDLAAQDIQKAMQLRGDQRWITDLQAIELESRMKDGS